VAALQDEAPPRARIESLEAEDAAPKGYEGFAIRHSHRQEGEYQLISPDIATCPDCLRELLDPADRRYRYPFINCTNCGPRFTIIQDIPYDRPNTTMRVFPMCPDCRREYEDPRDRRFHAQPNACPVCGPRLELVRRPTLPEEVWASRGEGDIVAQAANLLRAGAILAIKGLGGFHLACDATDAAAVRTLRARKRRPHKPFAVMMATLEEVRAHCWVGTEEEALLTSPECPIVLLPWRPESDVVEEVAPGYRFLGVMLPYTPLHHLLLRDVGRPLVMTSGNLSEEPIAAENDETLRRLGDLADAFILHNRDIYARYDDSVWFVPGRHRERHEGHEGEKIASCPSWHELLCTPQPVRRARGYAPYPIKVPFSMRQVLACGAELKNTFCLTRDAYAFVSQHIGDMENLETWEHFQRTVRLYEHLFRIRPEVVAYDLHPDYLATRYAQERLAAEAGLEPVPVQHHHAHIAACLADNAWPPEAGPVIGVALDGTGYGQDGRIWGGEWLVADYQGFRRAGHLEYLPLPGGDAATREPWRIAVAYAHALLGAFPEEAVPEDVPAALRDLLHQQLERRVNCPLTSSMGRLFDAVSAMLGVRARISYEAQAAVELEMLALGFRGDEESLPPYPFRLEEGDGAWVVRLGGLWAALWADVRGRRPVQEVAWRFHRTVAQMTVEVCQRLAQETGLHTVALSGGCYQNRLLLRLTVPALEAAGFQVLLHRQVPANDGGLSLGQAAIAGQMDRRPT
ncbi:MAG: carbamoyltransferase HypF, partial [Anaerolineae bacterium]|nr:carbamoyltransferase HypF [Anaerolineae bacterium]